MFIYPSRFRIILLQFVNSSNSKVILLPKLCIYIKTVESGDSSLETI